MYRNGGAITPESGSHPGDGQTGGGGGGGGSGGGGGGSEFGSGRSEGLGIPVTAASNSLSSLPRAENDDLACALSVGCSGVQRGRASAAEVAQAESRPAAVPVSGERAAAVCVDPNAACGAGFANTQPRRVPGACRPRPWVRQLSAPLSLCFVFFFFWGGGDNAMLCRDCRARTARARRC